MPTKTITYCPYCGKTLAEQEVKHKYCKNCDRYLSQQPVNAVEVLVVADETVLMQKRATGRFPDTWGFPGGHLHANEPPWEGAARELEEETGLQVAVTELSLFDITYDVNDDGSQYLVIGYIVPVSKTNGSINRQSDETIDLEYWSPSNFPDDEKLFHKRYRHRARQATKHIDEIVDVSIHCSRDLRST
ncbi:MAG: NUDIX hydrolase [Halobacteriaceae archaeon]